MIRFFAVRTPHFPAGPRWLVVVVLLALAPFPSQATASAPADVAEVDDFGGNDDYTSEPADLFPEDDPGNGGPAPTAVPLGSDAASAVVLLAGVWYARRRLRRPVADAG